MSIQAISWVLESSEAQGIDRLVLIAMANHENEGVVGVSKATIAHEAGRVSEATVWRSQQRLQACGELVPVSAKNAPEWWHHWPVNRRPRLWLMHGWLSWLGSRNATSQKGLGSRQDVLGVAQGSRSSATHSYIPSTYPATRSETTPYVERVLADAEKTPMPDDLKAFFK